MRHVPFFGSWDFQKSYLAVDLFFILSGVVIANAYQKRLKTDLSPAQFILMRIVRIYPLYLLGCTVTATYWIASGEFPSGNMLVIAASALLLIPNLSSRNNPFPLNGPAWSLFSEMLANVFYAYTVSRLNRKNLLSIMGISAAWMAYVIWTHHDLNVGFYTRDILSGLCRVAYSFSAGVLLHRIFYQHALQRYATAIRGSSTPWLILLIVAILLTVSLRGETHGVYDMICVTVVFPALVLAAMVFNPCGKSASVFKFLGVVSYPVYSLHSPVAKWIPIAVDVNSANIHSHPLALGIAFVAVLVPLSWLLDKYYDIPFRKIALPFGFSCLARIRSAKIMAATK